MKIDPRQRIENLAQGVVEDAPDVHRTQRQCATLLLDVAKLLAQENEVAVLLAERHVNVAEHLLDRLLHRFELRRVR